MTCFSETSPALLTKSYASRTAVSKSLSSESAPVFFAAVPRASVLGSFWSTDVSSGGFALKNSLTLPRSFSPRTSFCTRTRRLGSSFCSDCMNLKNASAMSVSPTNSRSMPFGALGFLAASVSVASAPWNLFSIWCKVSESTPNADARASSRKSLPGSEPNSLALVTASSPLLRIRSMIDSAFSSGLNSLLRKAPATAATPVSLKAFLIPPPNFFATAVNL